MIDPFNDPTYQVFVEESAQFCRCCECGNPPCDGVLAGGMCDRWCHCGALNGDHDHEGDPDELDECPDCGAPDPDACTCWERCV